MVLTSLELCARFRVRLLETRARVCFAAHNGIARVEVASRVWLILLQALVWRDFLFVVYVRRSRAWIIIMPLVWRT